MSRSPLSRWFVALVIASMVVSVGMARSAAPARAEDKPDALRAIIVAAACGVLPSDVTGKGSKDGVHIDMTARLLNPFVSACDPEPDAAATDKVLVSKTTDNAPLGCDGQPPLGFCELTMAKVTLPGATAGTPPKEICFALVGASHIAGDLPLTGVDDAIVANEDYGGDTFSEFCLTNGTLTPLVTYNIPAAGSTDQPTLLPVPGLGAYDPTTGTFGFVLPRQLVRSGSRVEVLTPKSTGNSFELAGYSAPDHEGPSAPAGLRTDVTGLDGTPVTDWVPSQDPNLESRLSGLQPATSPLFGAPGSLFFSGSAGGSGRSDAATDSIKIDDIFGFETTPIAGHAPLTCVPAAGVLCASDKPMPAGNVFVVGADMAAPIPATGSDFLVYQLGFDSDGKPDNNRQPSADFPNDPLQGTDVTYEAHYEPSIDRWSMVASDARQGDVLNNKPSAAQAVISGNSIAWFIPASELDSPAPNFRIATTIGDADRSMSPDTTAVDAAPGGPDVDWATLQPMDVTDLSSLIAPVGPEPSKPTVTGGCITTQSGGPPIISQWHVVVRGLGKLQSPGLEVNMKTKNGTVKISGITLGDSGAQFATAFTTPGTYAVTSILVVPQKGKPVNVTKSFEDTFAKTFKISTTDALAVGPDC